MVPRYDRRHALPVQLLAVGFALAIALLEGSTQNPYLYLRF